MSNPDIEFHFDIGSPYSYLAATQIPRLEEATRARVQWRPFLLGGVFKASGNEMPARVASKAAWMLRDLQRWASHYDVPFRMASRFPLNTLLAQRTLVAAGRVHSEEAIGALATCLFDAYWVRDLDVASPQVLVEAAEHCGLDGQRILAEATQPGCKEKLRADTEDAVRRGAFGAPTFFVGEHMFWGNDRLPMIEALFAR